MALSPTQDRAECARRPTRAGARPAGCRCSRPRPWRCVGSPRIAKSPASSSGRLAASRARPLRSAATSSWSYQIQVTSTAGLGELGGELELHGDTRLHVDRAAAPEVVRALDRLEPGRQVVVHRDGVDVAGDDDALGAAEARCAPRRRRRGGSPRGGRVRRGRPRSRPPARVSLPDDRLDVAEPRGEFDRGRGEVEWAHPVSLSTLRWPEAAWAREVPDAAARTAQPGTAPSLADTLEP